MADEKNKGDKERIDIPENATIPCRKFGGTVFIIGACIDEKTGQRKCRFFTGLSRILECEDPARFDFGDQYELVCGHPQALAIGKLINTKG